MGNPKSSLGRLVLEMVKKCKSCGGVKEISEFYIWNINLCKNCVNIKKAARRVLHFAELRIKERLRRRCRGVTDLDKRRRQGREADHRARARNPEFMRLKKKVRWLVSCAVKRGDLIKPDSCQECGNIGEIEAHHDDYNRPLDVRWLCLECHYGLRSPYGVTRIGRHLEDVSLHTPGLRTCIREVSGR